MSEVREMDKYQSGLLQSNHCKNPQCHILLLLLHSVKRNLGNKNGQTRIFPLSVFGDISEMKRDLTSSQLKIVWFLFLWNQMVKHLKSFAMNLENDNVSCNSVESLHWQPFLQLNLFHDEGCNTQVTQVTQITQVTQVTQVTQII